jgi:hypothetical protein
MALVIFPIGLVLGWLVAPPRRAAFATHTIGFGAFVVLSLLWGFTSIQVSPWETVVLLVGTPFAGALASWVAQRRLTHRRRADERQEAPGGGDAP